MSNVEFTKIFTILAKFGANNGWVNAADSETYGTKDGEVSKSEFRKFIRANWDGNASGEYDKDLVNDFFNTFDVNSKTNKTMNKFDKAEQAEIGKNLAIYVEFDEYVKNNVSIPSELKSTGAAWKSGVIDDLSAELNNFVNMSESEKAGMTLADYLSTKLPQIQNKNTALCYKTEYADSLKSTILKDYPQYKPNADETLDKLIEAYIKQISTPDENGDFPSADIISDIENLVDAYFATAGLGTGDKSDLEQYGFGQTESSPLNDIQKSVLAKRLDDQINNQMEAILAAIFPDITLSDSVKAEFTEVLKTLLANAQNEFVSTLTYGDFNKEISFSLNGTSVIDGNTLVFNPLDYVTDEAKAPVLEQYYTSKVSSIVGTFVEELVAGINNDEASLKVYDANKGEIKLDKETARKLAIELSEVGKEFIKAYIAEGGDFTNIEESLKTFLTNYLTGAGNTKTKADMQAMQANYGIFISDEELPKYKEECIKHLGELFKYNSSAKLGSSTINASNYKDVINAYTDGNKLFDDMEALIKTIDSTNRIYKLVEEAQEALKKEAVANIGANAKFVADLLPDILNKELATIIGSNSKLHTEFRIDKDGNIQFQEQSVTDTYNRLKTQIKAQLNATEEGKAVLASLGEANLDKLIQAAWIMTYNSYNSSQKNNAAGFVGKVFENLKTILTKLESKPELLEVYTMHTAYSNSDITSGLIHYNTKTTHGGDEKIKYKGEIKVDEQGVVHISNGNDDPDYQSTMSALLTRLIEKYSMLDSTLVTSVFREAQQKSLKTLQSNTRDCPYGTGNNKSRVDDTTINWGGEDSRDGDGFVIHMDELVEITLYYFDKLLYEKLATA